MQDVLTSLMHCMLLRKLVCVYMCRPSLAPIEVAATDVYCYGTHRAVSHPMDVHVCYYVGIEDYTLLNYSLGDVARLLDAVDKVTRISGMWFRSSPTACLAVLCNRGSNVPRVD